MRLPESFAAALRHFDRALTSRVERLRVEAAANDAEYERQERIAERALRSLRYERQMQEQELLLATPEPTVADPLCDHCLDTASGVRART